MSDTTSSVTVSATATAATFADALALISSPTAPISTNPSTPTGTDSTPTPAAPVNYFPPNPADAPFPSPAKSRITGTGGEPYLIDLNGTILTLGAPTPGAAPLAPTYYPIGGNVRGEKIPTQQSANAGYVAYANGSALHDDTATAAAGGNPWAVIYMTQLIMDGTGHCWSQAANGQWYEYVSGMSEVQGNPPSFAVSGSATTSAVVAGGIPALPAPASPAPGEAGVTLTVGAGQTYTTIGAAVKAAPAGATVLVKPGTYNESFTTSVPLLLKADGGAVVMDLRGMTAKLAYGKGAIVPLADCIIDGDGANGGSWTVQNVAVDQTESQMTACVRPDVGCNYLTIRNGVVLQNSQTGVAAGGNLPNLTVVLDNITIQSCGLPDNHSHNIYVDAIRALICRDVKSINPTYAHAVKSRALYTEITGADGQVNAAHASPIDLPDGTAIPAFINDITISKSASDDNHLIFSQNEESTKNGTAGAIFGSAVVWQIACPSPIVQVDAGNVWNIAPIAGTPPTGQGSGTILGF